MLLSEAIRMGGLFGPQCSQMLFARMSDGTVRTCALGGAILACGIADRETAGIWGYHLDLLRQRFHSLEDLTPWLSIISFNDDTGATRDEIADWIIANGHDCESVGGIEQEETKAPKGVLAGGAG